MNADEKKQLARSILEPDDLTVVREMRQLVEDTHWIKHDYARSAPPGDKPMFCLVGMIDRSLGFYDERGQYAGRQYTEGQLDVRSRVINALWHAIRVVKPRTRTTQVEGWNDASRTTREDVLQVLDLLIEGPVGDDG